MVAAVVLEGVPGELAHDGARDGGVVERVDGVQHLQEGGPLHLGVRAQGGRRGIRISLCNHMISLYRNKSIF